MKIRSWSIPKIDRRVTIAPDLEQEEEKLFGIWFNLVKNFSVISRFIFGIFLFCVVLCNNYFCSECVFYFFVVLFCFSVWISRSRNVWLLIDIPFNLYNDHICCVFIGQYYYYIISSWFILSKMNRLITVSSHVFM